MQQGADIAEDYDLPNVAPTAYVYQEAVPLILTTKRNTRIGAHAPDYDEIHGILLGEIQHTAVSGNVDYSVVSGNSHCMAETAPGNNATTRRVQQHRARPV